MTPSMTPSMTFVPWDVAWHEALYGPGGFYRGAAGPAGHFRTSVHVSDLFASSLLRLVQSVGLGRVVDVGSGRGELLESLRRNARRQSVDLELVGCDVVERPEGLPDDVAWVRAPGGAGLPDALGQWASGALVVAHEWLDDVPCAVVERDASLGWRTVEVDRVSGRERLGPPLDAEQRAWLDRWWVAAEPAQPGDRAEVGTTRDAVWAGLVADARGSLLLAVDYAHLAGGRPAAGSLLGYRGGVACVPVPDGSCDVTAHVAMDAVAAAGAASGAGATLLTTQREALRTLGVDGRLPDHSAAATDPLGYLTAVSTASHAAELLDPTGLGGFAWLLQSTGPPLPTLAR